MDRLLHVLLSGFRQSAISQRVLASNLANLETIGYRADATRDFRSLYLAQGGALSSRVFATSGVQSIDSRDGAIMRTGNELDVAVQGDGYLLVRLENGEQVLSRRGDLRVIADGALVNGAGQQVIGDAGPIVIPPYRALHITSDGTINIVPLEAEQDAPPVALARLALVARPAGGIRRREDGNLEPADGRPTPLDGSQTVITGSLEKSNVNTVEVLGEMVEISRLFEAQSRLMKITSTLDESGAALMRSND